ncbi:hypothetical protein QQY66_49280 [Streptomyces sp. DG2A-72]|uniref:hypothetical protein n=1 Tax=Streptomyces sp. DG2A-72 TaxID=3051386 RepID=UPI00265B9F99|nr:hypothetical protein [Streptomyces sp. DG2A-72]MDO0939306.1 hypothetical protein [Streptomyces sp. DG2A-72]
MLGLRCALRADARGHVQLPAELPRGMRPRGHRELWQELTHADLEPLAVRSVPMQVRLLDAAVLDQAPVAVPAAAPPTGPCTPHR